MPAPDHPFRTTITPATTLPLSAIVQKISSSGQSMTIETLPVETFQVERFHDDGRREVLPHAHDRGQFTCVLSGVVSQEAEDGLWVVPRQRLVWIPPRTIHAARSKGPVEGWLAWAPARYARQLPDRVCVLRTSALLLAALERLTELSAADGPAADLLSQV